MRTQGWTEETVRQQILDVSQDAEVSSFSAIDITSIMMCVLDFLCQYAAHIWNTTGTLCQLK